MDETCAVIGVDRSSFLRKVALEEVARIDGGVLPRIDVGGDPRSAFPAPEWDGHVEECKLHPGGKPVRGHSEINFDARKGTFECRRCGHRGRW